MCDMTGAVDQHSGLQVTLYNDIRNIVLGCYA